MHAMCWYIKVSQYNSMTQSIYSKAPIEPYIIELLQAGVTWPNTQDIQATTEATYVWV